MPVRKFRNGNDVEWYVACEKGIEEVLEDSFAKQCETKISFGLARHHLQKDYSKAKGLVRLGYTNPRPFLVFSTERNKAKVGKKYSLVVARMVRCDQGCLSHDEALCVRQDRTPLPTPQQIARRSLAIRQKQPKKIPPSPPEWWCGYTVQEPRVSSV